MEEKAIPEKILQPDAVAHKLALQNFEKSTSELLLVTEKLTASLASKKKERENIQKQLKEVIDVLKSSSNDRKGLGDLKTKVESDIAKLEEQRKANIERMKNMRKGLKYSTLDEVDREIYSLEHEVEIGAATLQIEKDLLKKIKATKAIRTRVAEYTTYVNSVNSRDDEYAALKAKRKKIIDERNSFFERNDKVQKKKADLSSLNSKINSDIDKILKEKQETWSLITKLRNERTALQRAFDQQTRLADKWTRYQQNLVRAKKREEYKAKSEERQKIIDDWEKEEEKRDPYLTQKLSLESLVSYLSRLAGIEPKSKKIEPEEKSTPFHRDDDITVGLEGQSLATIKPVGIPSGLTFVPSEPAPKKKGKKRQGKKSAILTHDTSILKEFATHGIDAPISIAKIPDILTKLEEKIEYYKTAPRPIKKDKKKTEKVVEKVEETKEKAADVVEKTETVEITPEASS